MMESLRIVLTHLIDYAGLFPPARLPMEASVANFDAYLRSPHAWILNRFVVPATALELFVSVFEQVPRSAEPRSPWKLTVIAGADPQSDVAKILEFNRRLSADSLPVVIESVEMKAHDPSVVHGHAASIPRPLESYFEVPASGPTKDCINAIAAVGARAKLRTGGETAEMFPSCAELAYFLAACASVAVPFKCSAGLHHAMPSTHAYTYEPDSPTGMMHGFLNVFVAATFACNGLDSRQLARLLAEDDAKALVFEPPGVRWNTHHLTNEMLSSARNSFGISFGSCSFAEPVDELCALGLL